MDIPLKALQHLIYVMSEVGHDSVNNSTFTFIQISRPLYPLCYLDGLNWLPIYSFTAFISSERICVAVWTTGPGWHLYAHHNHWSLLFYWASSCTSISLSRGKVISVDNGWNTVRIGSMGWVISLSLLPNERIPAASLQLFLYIVFCIMLATDDKI